MSQDSVPSKKSRIAKRLLKVVGQAGSAVGGFAGDLLRSAGQTAKSAGSRAALTFTTELKTTPDLSLREVAESLTRWLVQEHQGKADLQQQKPSTVELTQLTQSYALYEVMLEEPGISGRKFRFVLSVLPRYEYGANFPQIPEHFDDAALLVLAWPQDLLQEPTETGIIVWDHAAQVGPRNPAVDLLQTWLNAEFGGTFAHREVFPRERVEPEDSPRLFGRDEELALAEAVLLTPTSRALRNKPLVSLAAPGGTGKSYFLKVLRERLRGRVLWAAVDHQGIEADLNSVAMLGRFLSQLAAALEKQSVKMERFSRELRNFRKQLNTDEAQENGGFFAHLKKAAETTAGLNPVIGALSAGVVFFSSWRQEAKEESEALAKDDAVKALTEAFKRDLIDYTDSETAQTLCWARPVLVFDTYEWLAPLVDTWVRTELLDDNFLHRSRVVLILSGREHLFRVDTRWSEWQHLVTKVLLRPFDRELTAEYLANLGVEQERVEELFELTEGLPLFLSLVAHIDERDQALDVLAERVLEEVAPSHRHDFLKASLLDSFEQKQLRALYSDYAKEELEVITGLLKNATFTVAQDGKRAFLPLVRRILQRVLVLEFGQTEYKILKSRVAE